jgi:hypothetical protein
LINFHGLSLNGLDADVYHVDEDQTIFPVHLLEDKNIADQDLKGMLTGLFGAFAEKGPGMRRFFRMVQVHVNKRATGAECHYGPLVKVHDTKTEVGPHVISSSANIVTAAYRLTRSGQAAEQMKHPWRKRRKELSCVNLND